MRGNCYEANARKMLLGDGYQDCVLVHAVVRNALDGEPMGHCWLERGDAIYDFSQANTRPDLKIEKVLYYELGGIPVAGYEDRCEYTIDQVREKVAETGHWGPWDHQPPR